MNLQYLNDPDFWLSTLVIIVLLKFTQFVFISIKTYIEERAIEKYKQELKNK